MTSVAFYASTNLTNNLLVGTAKSAPWTVQWAHVPAGDYSLTAVTTDKQGASTTSDPVAIQVEKPSVVTDQSSLTVAKGHTTSVGVSLSTAPSSDVTVHLNDSGTGTSVSKGQTLTFTPSDWNKPQQATVAAAQAKTGSQSTITASASGLGSASVAVTDAATASGYDEWFLSLYDDITNPSNGYFSPLGIPYHSVEELIVEAPDYGHETTSETYSYWLWLAADYGRVSGDWTEFNTAWSNMEQYMIPNAANQPGCSAYNASDPATYGPEEASPSDYPVALNSSVPVGSDPLYAELNTTYGNCDIYAPMWIMDTDNRYGFGQQENGTSTPSCINTFQRGSEESVWDTVPQPDWDTLTDGESGSGYLDLFNNGGGSFAAQYKYTDAPDADARLIQAAYWAEQYATAQGNQSQISLDPGRRGQARRLPAVLDVRQVLQADQRRVQPGRLGGLPGRHVQGQRGHLPAVLVLRLRRLHHRRLVLADQRHRDPRGVPEPAGGLRAVQHHEPDPAVPVGQVRLVDQPHHAAQHDAVAAVGRGRDRGRRHQQLGRQLRRRVQAAVR